MGEAPAPSRVELLRLCLDASLRITQGLFESQGALEADRGCALRHRPLRDLPRSTEYLRRPAQESPSAFRRLVSRLQGQPVRTIESGGDGAGRAALALGAGKDAVEGAERRVVAGDLVVHAPAREIAGV